MAENQTIKADHLPVLTWFKNNLNEAAIDISGDTIDAIKGALHPAGLIKPEYPEGIEVKEGVSFSYLEELFENKGYRIDREEYVAGKYPIYQEQIFPTGMGEGIDDLIKMSGVPVRVIEVKAGAKIDKPLYLHYIYPAGSEDIDVTFIHVNEGAELSVIQNLDSQGFNGKGFAGTQTRVIMEPYSKLHLSKVQCLADGFSYFNDMGCRIEDNAEFNYTELAIGAAESYLGCHADQRGYQSKFRADIGFIGLQGSNTDINYTDVFRGKKSEGVMRFSGVLLEDAKKASRETLDFRKGCTGADGDEEENILMLGRNVVNKAIPLILGEEEKVNGRHAATSGKLSEEMLFYLETRGIDERVAREMMIRSNINRVSRLIPNKEIEGFVEARIDRIFSECDGNCRQCPTAH